MNMLEQSKQRRRRIMFISWIAGTLFVIASLTVCIIVNAQINDFLLNAEKCTATVSDIKEGIYEEKEDGSVLSNYRKGIYTAYVDYAVDGVKYNNIIAGNVSSSANIGDKVEIYYNKSNPKNIKLSDNITSINGAVFLLALALIVGIVGIIVMIIKFKKLKKASYNLVYKNKNKNKNKNNIRDTSYYKSSNETFTNQQPHSDKTFTNQQLNSDKTFNNQQLSSDKTINNQQNNTNSENRVSPFKKYSK